MNTFEKLKQPPLTPPGWVFPVVWTGLFAMMGTASYLVAITPKTEERKKALTLYGIQLAVNFLWPVFFFNAGWYLFAFAWLLFLWYLVYLCTKAFSEFSRTAGYLMIPYLFVELILLSGALSGGAVPCVTYLKLVLDNAVKIT